MSNPILERMAAHQSVRQFGPEPLQGAQVQQAVRAAQRAATSSNIQAYSLIRIKDAAKRERLAELCGGQPQVAEAGGFFVVCADQHRNVLIGEKLERPHQANLETFMLGVIDATLFAQNLVLAFESQGFGTCMIGGLRNQLPEVDAMLGLPPDVMPVYGLCVGKVARDAPQTEQRPRLPVEAVLMQDSYQDDAAMMGQVTAHDREAAAWYERQGRPGYNWSGGVARNFRTAERGGLLAYYRSKGAQFR